MLIKQYKIQIVLNHISVITMANTSNSMQKTSKLEVKYSKSNFAFHNFISEINNNTVMYQIVKMLDSVYIWIGNNTSKEFTDLSLGMINKFENKPISTRLIGDTTEETSKNMALKLSKKLNKVVYISVNIPEDKFTWPLIEKRLQEEIERSPEYF